MQTALLAVSTLSQSYGGVSSLACLLAVGIQIHLFTEDWLRICTRSDVQVSNTWGLIIKLSGKKKWRTFSINEGVKKTKRRKHEEVQEVLVVCLEAFGHQKVCPVLRSTTFLEVSLCRFHALWTVKYTSDWASGDCDIWQTFKMSISWPRYSGGNPRSLVPCLRHWPVWFVDPQFRFGMVSHKRLGF